MNYVIEKLQLFLYQNPWLNLLFLILALASIITSLVIYLKSKKEKKPYFNKRSFTLIQDQLGAIEDVQILFRGKPVRNLTLTKFALWNGGRDPIYNDDIAPTDQIHIEVTDNADLLSAQIVYSATQANNFISNINREQKRISISFDYFSKNEGVVLNIYHTGSDNNIVLKGTIMGVSSFTKRSPHEDPLIEKLEPIILPVIRMLRKIRKFALLFWPLISIFMTIIIPIIIPFLVMDAIGKFVRRVPTEFKLGED